MKPKSTELCPSNFEIHPTFHRRISFHLARISAAAVLLSFSLSCRALCEFGFGEQKNLITVAPFADIGSNGNHYLNYDRIIMDHAAIEMRIGISKSVSGSVSDQPGQWEINNTRIGLSYNFLPEYDSFEGWNFGLRYDVFKTDAELHYIGSWTVYDSTDFLNQKWHTVNGEYQYSKSIITTSMGIQLIYRWVIESGVTVEIGFAADYQTDNSIMIDTPLGQEQAPVDWNGGWITPVLNVGLVF